MIINPLSIGLCGILEFFYTCSLDGCKTATLIGTGIIIRDSFKNSGQSKVLFFLRRKGNFKLLSVVISLNIYKTALGYMVHIIDIQIVNDRYSKQLFEKKPTGLNGHISGI